MKKFLENYSGVLATLVVFAFMLTPVLVGANNHTVIDNSSGSFNGSSGSLNGSSGGKTNVLTNPLGNKSICGLVTGLLQAVMVIGIPIAILFIVWAGFKFVLAQGNPGALEKARTNFLNVIIGIAIFVGASLIGSVIINTVKALGVQGISSC